MAVIDDFTAAIAAEDQLVDQAVAFITGTPAIVQSAFDAGKAGNDAALATLLADVNAHAAALTAALPAPTVTATTPAVPAPPGV